jgi:NAD(P)-dependent dehydrogenase (short-subunit alcohol dehydrogenase family)
MKSILITGAGGNLGRAVIDEFSGDHKIYAALGLGEDVRFFESHPNKANIETEFINLTDETACEAYVKKVMGMADQLQTAILLVGGWQKGQIEETRLAELDKMIKLNFATAFNVVRPLFEYYKRSGVGRFVFIGARPAVNPIEAKDQFAYALSKSLVIKMAEVINQSNKDGNIQAHVLVPSTLDTPQNRTAMPNADPSKWVNPKHIAQSIRFLLGEAGHNLHETVLKIYNQA